MSWKNFEIQVGSTAGTPPEFELKSNDLVARFRSYNTTSRSYGRIQFPAIPGITYTAKFSARKLTGNPRIVIDYPAIGAVVSNLPINNDEWEQYVLSYTVPFDSVYISDVVTFVFGLTTNDIGELEVTYPFIEAHKAKDAFNFIKVTETYTVNPLTPDTIYVNPAANMDIVFPTVGVNQGRKIKVVIPSNPSKYTVTIKEDTTVVESISEIGHVELVADFVSSTVSSWKIIDVLEKVRFPLTFVSGAGTGATYPTYDFKMQRHNNVATFSTDDRMLVATGTGATTSIATAVGAIPTRFRPIATTPNDSRTIPVVGYNSGDLSDVCFFLFRSTGGLELRRSSAWPSSAGAVGVFTPAGSFLIDTTTV